MKVINYGHEIRFVEKHPGYWWAVASDIANVLNYSQVTNMLRKLKSAQKGLHLMNTLGGYQEISVISETGIYKVIMRSRRKEAEEFEDWVLETLRTLRQSTGLEGSQVFRMLDKNKTHPIRTQ
ncbi:Bro-N domain-containing protein [Paenibacillus sp. ov031]|uniref:BRO-N domain-containing protein n=1 Tax=Paenibacillus sp. ov031 TaxID=1761879 RepID=UPI000934524B|nr:Bro-N domain-containing protein [Paenibacillus sp. ov031]